MQLKIFLIIALLCETNITLCMQKIELQDETNQSIFSLRKNNNPDDDQPKKNNSTLPLLQDFALIHIIPQIIIKQSTSNAALGAENLINNNNWLIQKHPQELSFRIFKKIPIEKQNTDLIKFHPIWTLYDVVAHCKNYNANPYFIFDASIFSPYEKKSNFYNSKIYNRKNLYLQNSQTNNPKTTLHILCTPDELTESFFMALSITSNKGYLEQATHKLAEMIMSPLQLPTLQQSSANDSEKIRTTLYHFLKEKLMKPEYLTQINHVLESDPDPEKYGIDKNTNQWKNYSPPTPPQNQRFNLLWSKLKNKITTASSWLWRPFNYFKTWWQWLATFKKGIQ